MTFAVLVWHKIHEKETSRNKQTQTFRSFKFSGSKNDEAWIGMGLKYCILVKDWYKDCTCWKSHS